jgi:XTP/dITP diphosphohydrolase
MVTSNAGKAAAVAAFFGGLLEVDHVALEVPEHRSRDIAEIARRKAQFAFSQLNTASMGP